MSPTQNGKSGAPCTACGHAAGLHSNEACEAIRCTCRVTRKQLANGVGVVTKSAIPATIMPAFPDEVSVPVAPAPRKRRRRGGSHAA